VDAALLCARATHTHTDASGDEIDPIAAMSLLRGRVYDMQQNRIKAAICYQDALRRDVKCYEGASACSFLCTERARFCAQKRRRKKSLCHAHAQQGETFVACPTTTMAPVSSNIRAFSL
jgi:hypothetical protein